MDRFSEIFTPPESPNPNYNPCENILRHTQDMDEAIEVEQRSAHIRQFMNLLNEAETGNVLVTEERGATGRQAPSPPPHVTGNPDPGNVQIVNEYDSFNLQNITPPAAPKWKQSETQLEDFHKFKCSCQHIFMVQCVISRVERSKQACFLFGLVLMGKTSMKVSICHPMRPMMLTW